MRQTFVSSCTRPLVGLSWTPKNTPSSPTRVNFALLDDPRLISEVIPDLRGGKGKTLFYHPEPMQGRAPCRLTAAVKEHIPMCAGREHKAAWDRAQHQPRLLLRHLTDHVTELMENKLFHGQARRLL